MLAVCIGGIPFGMLLERWLGGDWWFAGWVFGGLLTGIPIDRFIDDRSRRLEK
jgi:hypothetical protein